MRKLRDCLILITFIFGSLALAAASCKKTAEPKINGIPAEFNVVPKTLVFSLADTTNEMLPTKMAILKMFLKTTTKPRLLLFGDQRDLDLLKKYDSDFIKLLKKTEIHILFKDGDFFYVNSSWTRDFAPILVETPEGPKLVAFKYVADETAIKGNVTYKDLQQRVAHAMKLPIEFVDLKVEGGNLMTDHKGRLYVTDKLIRHNPEMTRKQIESLLKEKLLASEVVWLPRLPYAIESTGHIDMFLNILDEKNAVVMTSTAPKIKEVLDQIADALKERGFKVHRLKLVKVDNPYRGDSVPAVLSHANAVEFGDVLQIPKFGTPEDQVAFAVYTKLGYKVEFAPGVTVFFGGSVHCLTYLYPY